MALAGLRRREEEEQQPQEQPHEQPHEQPSGIDFKEIWENLVERTEKQKEEAEKTVSNLHEWFSEYKPNEPEPSPAPIPEPEQEPVYEPQGGGTPEPEPEPEPEPAIQTNTPVQVEEQEITPIEKTGVKDTISDLIETGQGQTSTGGQNAPAEITWENEEFESQPQEEQTVTPVVQPVSTSKEELENQVKHTPQQEDAASLYEDWKNLVEAEDAGQTVPRGMQRAEDESPLVKPKAGNMVVPQGGSQNKTAAELEGQWFPAADYYSNNPEVRKYTPGTEEYAALNDYYSDNPETRKYTPGTQEYANMLETGTPYSQEQIDETINYMRNVLGIFDPDPAQEQEYAVGLIERGDYVPSSSERISPGIQTRNEIASQLVSNAAEKVGNDIGASLASIGEGIGNRNEILGNIASKSYENLVNGLQNGASNIAGGIQDRNDILGQLVENASSNIRNGIRTRNGVFSELVNNAGDYLSNVGNNLANGIAERNGLVGPVANAVKEDIAKGISKRNAILSVILNGGLSGNNVPEINRSYEEPFIDESIYNSLTPEQQELFYQGVPLEDLLDAQARQDERISTVTENTPERFQGQEFPTNAEILGSIPYWVDVHGGKGGEVALQNAIDETLFSMGIDPASASYEQRDRIGKLIEQINNDDKIDPFDERPWTNGRSREEYAEDAQELIDNVGETVGGAVDSLVETVKGIPEDFNASLNIRNQADIAADRAGLAPGTPEYDRFIEDYVQQRAKEAELGTLKREDYANVEELTAPGTDTYNASKKARLDAMSKADLRTEEQKAWDDLRAISNQRREDERISDILDYAIKNNMSAQKAQFILENPNSFDENGNYKRTGINDLVMSPPAMVNGKPNESLQAILNGEFEVGIPGLEPNDITHEGYAERILGLYDQDNNGLIIPDDVKALLADDKYSAFLQLDSEGLGPEGVFDNSHPKNVQYADVDDETYKKMVEKFIQSNPALKALVDNRILSDLDIAKHFFKAPKSAKPKPGTKTPSSGYGKGGYTSRKSYGGGGRYYGGGSSVRTTGGSNYSYGNSNRPTTTGTRQDTSQYYPQRANNNQIQPKVQKQKDQRINNIMKNWSF